MTARPRSPRRRIAALLLVAIACGSLAVPSVHGTARLLLLDALAPPSLAASTAVDSLDRAALLARTVQLEAELRRWKPPVADLPEVVRTDLVPVRVLAVGEDAALLRTPEPLRAGDLIVTAGQPHIDRGARSGLAADDLLLAGRWLVGRISDAGPLSSAFQPLTDAALAQPVQLITADGRAVRGGRGMLEGTGDGCTLAYLPADVAVAPGQWAVTWAGGGVLLCGQIAAATLPPGASHWEIAVTPPPAAHVGQSLAVLRRTLNLPSAAP